MKHNLPILLLFVIICLVCNESFSQASSAWTKLTDFPGAARSSAVSFTINGKGYLGLGKNDNGSLKDFWSYDPTTDEWDQIADFGGNARMDAVAFVLDGKAYVGLGQSGIYPNYVNEKDFWVYDPEENQWTSAPDFEGSARYGAVAFVSEGKGMVLLGRDDNGYPTDVWEFDPSGNGQWNSKNTFTAGGRIGVFTFTVNNTTYIGSGPSFVDGVSQLNNNIVSYLTDVDEWSEKEVLPSSMHIQNGMTAFSQEGLGYVLSDGETWVFDPESESWSTGEALEQGLDLVDAATFMIDDVAYVVGGYKVIDIFDTEYVNYFFKYAPPFPVPADPTNVKASALTEAGITISWTDNATNEQGYEIERYIDDEHDGIKEASIILDTLAANATSFVDLDVEYDQRYYYVVKAIHENGDSEGIETSMLLLSAVAKFTATPSSATQITLNWTYESEATQSFNFYKSIGDAQHYENFANRTYPTSVDSEFQASGLEENTLYYFGLQIEPASQFSASPLVQASATTKLHSPINLKWKVNGEGVTLSWEDQSLYESGYVIERSLGSPDAFVSIDTTDADQELYIYNEEHEGEIYYRVKAISADNTSAYSESTSLFYIQLPTDLKAINVSADSITLSWTNKSEIAKIISLKNKYYIEESESYIGGIRQDLNADITQFTHRELKENTLYRYSVDVATEDWEQAMYNWESIEVRSLLKTPSELSIATKETNRLQLSWVNNTTVGDYTVVIEMANEGGDFVEKASIVDGISTYWVEDINTEAALMFRVKIVTENNTSAYTQVVSSEDFVTGIAEMPGSEIALKLFPNPAHDVIQLDAQESIDRLEITDIRGRNIGQLAVNTKHIYDISSLKSGVYVLSVWSNGNVGHIKFVKE